MSSTEINDERSKIMKLPTNIMEEFTEIAEKIQMKTVANPIFITGIFIVIFITFLTFLIINYQYDNWPLVTALTSVSFTYCVYLANNYDIKKYSRTSSLRGKRV